MIDYSETYALLKEAAAKGKHVVKMGGRCSGKTYALEQLLTTAIRENNGLHDCIKQLEETLWEYETAMQQMTAERNRIDHRAERLEKGIHRLYWAGGIDID